MDGWMGGKAGLRIAYSNQKGKIWLGASVAELVKCLIVATKVRGSNNGEEKNILSLF
jgi:hypothetical protein